MGTALNLYNRRGEAAVTFREALRLDPDDPDALQGLGSAVWKLGRSEEAIELYRRALRIAPDDPYIHSHISAALKAKGRLDEAVSEAREAVRVQPGRPEYALDPRAMSSLGRSPGRGRGRLSRSLRNRPDHDSSLN